MSKPNIELHFQGPCLAKVGEVALDIPEQLRHHAGIYLWTVEFDGGYLVNYVGKTSRPFVARFRDYEKWYGDGKDILDADFMPKGENWLVENPTCDQIIQSLACFRVFLAPLNVDDDVLLRIESGLIQMFLSKGGKCRDFLGNKQKRIMPVAGQRVSISAEMVIHGLADNLLI